MRQVLFILLSIAYPILGYAQFEDISYNDKYRLDFDISRKDSTTSSFVRNNAYLQIGCMAYMNKEHKYEEVFTLPTSMSSSFRSVIRNRIFLPDVQRK